MTYRDPVLGTLDHTGDLDPEPPEPDDPMPPPPQPRHARVYDEATRFAWLTTRENAHRMARAARLRKDTARSDSHSGRAA